MTDVLIASDVQWVVDEVTAALSGGELTVRTVTDGRQVSVASKAQAPDIAVLDFQIGSMGGMATCLDLRLEESGGRLPRVPVLMLLDRQADVFLARRSQADGWLVKPLDPIRLRKAVDAVLAGEGYEDRFQVGDAATNYEPTPDSTAR